MNHVVEKVHEEPVEAPADDVVTDAKDFSGGSHDTSVLMDYVHHVAVTIWNGEVFIL